MNLKQAFRYQNKIRDILHHITIHLGSRSYITTVKSIHYKKDVFPSMENEELIENNNSLNVTPNQLIDFLCFILDEKETLCKAIDKAKKLNNLSIDTDIEMNIARHDVINTLTNMSSIKSEENLLKNEGFGYIYKEDYKEEAIYHYDIQEIKTINFDRNKVKKLKHKFSVLSDEISNNIEKVLLTTDVDYTPKFDVNSSFEEILEDYFT